MEKIKEQILLISQSKEPINPFEKNIRNRKLVYFFNNEDDVMDFGSWIHDYHFMYHGKSGQEALDNVVSFLYAIIELSGENLNNLSVLVEESLANHELYVSFFFPQYLPEDIINRYKEELGTETIKVDDTMVFIRVAMKEEFKKIYTGVKTVDAGEKMLLRQTHSEKLISAEDYFTNHGDSIRDEILDLADLEEELADAVSDLLDNFLKTTLIRVGEVMSKIANKINTLYAFAPLSYALSSLGIFLMGINEEDYKNIDKQKVSILIDSIKIDLSNWRINVFVSQIAENIHYLDSSLLSSCMQVEAVITAKEIEVADEDDNDLELF